MSESNTAENVKVVSRLRPFNRREYEIQDEMNAKLEEFNRKPLRSVIQMTADTTLFLDHTKDYALKENFKFDYNFWSIPPEQQSSQGAEFATQEIVYEKVGLPTLESSFDGYNACIFAYGQTSSGKTYTMTGQGDNPGLIPRLTSKLFEKIQEKKNQDDGPKMIGTTEVISVVWSVEARYLEIYNEHVKDLLWELADPSVWEHYDKANLKVRVIPNQGPMVVGLTSIPVQSWQECDDIINTGMQSRSTAATKMNDTSSRSHAIFSLYLKETTTLKPQKKYEQPKTLEKFSLINLVDLAGSERLKKTGAVGQRLKEAAAINLSLTTLKNVIDALVEKRKPPFRESILTLLIEQSVGGNSRTWMVACLSPHYDNADETFNTLRYALRTQGVVNHARINENDETKRIAELQKELKQAQEAISCGTGGQKAQLQREMEEKLAVISDLEKKAQKRKDLECELMNNIEEETVRTYRAVYSNQLRTILLRRMAARLSENSKQWQNLLDKVDDAIKTADDGVCEAAAELKQAKVEDERAKVALVRSERVKNGLVDQINEIQADTTRSLEHLTEIDKKFKGAAQRMLITHYMCTALLYIIQKRHTADYERRCRKYALDIQMRATELKHSRADFLSSYQLRVASLKNEMEEIQKEISSTKSEITAVGADYRTKIRQLREDITFYERENRSLDDERVERLTTFESDSSRKYNLEINRLSERSVKGRQATEQAHAERMRALCRQMADAEVEHKKHLEAVQVQWQRRLAVVEHSAEDAQVALGRTYSKRLQCYDKRVEDMRNFSSNWQYRHLHYDRVQREIAQFIKKRRHREDPELNDIVSIMQFNIAHDPRVAEAKPWQSRANSLVSVFTYNTAGGSSVAAPRSFTDGINVAEASLIEELAAPLTASPRVMKPVGPVKMAPVLIRTVLSRRNERDKVMSRVGRVGSPSPSRVGSRRERPVVQEELLITK